MKHLRIILVLAALIAAPLRAEPVPYALEGAKSKVGFTYAFSGKTTEGTMPVRAADLLIDLADISKSRIDVTLDPSRAKAGFVFATDAMKGPKVLDTARHPRIRFIARRITGDLSGAKVAGDLTVRGVTRPVTLDARLYRQQGTAADDLRRLSVLLTGSIDRRDFGAEGFPDLVGPTIGLRILARMERQ